jgi:hypothetical protein
LQHSALALQPTCRVFAFGFGFENETLKFIQMENKSTNDDVGTTAQTDANTVLAAMPIRNGKCYNCKHASSAFKIAGKTHHQCNHPKHEKGFESGELSPWDTLQEFYNSCESHEFRKA